MEDSKICPLRFDLIFDGTNLNQKLNQQWTLNFNIIF